MCTYAMSAECRNCGHCFEAAIAKGTPINQADAACPVCEVKQVHIKKSSPRLDCPYIPHVLYVPPYIPTAPRWPHYQDYWVVSGSTNTSIVPAKDIVVMN